ncbi:hypothetical protein BG015_009945 [Linnemannia schmuckeri]|uniref:F-box domain-containing protein n=1 Tax=Linnemannia schmuckeri TaxID=64567 RepID=A0A9P5RUS5_9FUNG|nr:hypothetical protein BG015_009945 [Linnemannia schmuckeri]
MNRIPLEVLLQIASHLDTQSCFACRNVCRYWAEAFIPSCWHTVDSLRSPWKQALKSPSSTQTPEEQEMRMLRVRSLLKRYGSHIRVITIRDDGLLDAAIKARLSRLDSLTICGIVNEYVYGQESAFMAVEQRQQQSLDSTTMTKAATSSAEAALGSWSELPSMTLFDTDFPKQCLMSRTQGCWLLITNNPGLRRLEFKNQTNYTIFPLKFFPPIPTTTPIPSGDFVDKVLARLPYLNHLAMEKPMADFVFVNLGTRYQNITSFVYPNTDDFANGILSKTATSTTLRRLKLQRRIDAENLAKIGRIFPELRELFLLIVQVSPHFQYSSDNGDDSGIVGQSKEPPLFSKLEYLSATTIYDIASLSRAGIRLPAVKRIDPTIKFRTLAYLWIVMRAYPTLEYLDAMETLSPNRRYGDALDPSSLKPTSSLRLRTLILSHGPKFGAGVGGMLEVMPMLSHLELGLIPPSALEVMAKNCRDLVHTRFNLEQGKGHKELNKLFKALSKLKVCRGRGHEILADDFVEDHNWTCFGLRELDLRIVGVPRMTEAQERIWETMQQDHRSIGNTSEERVAATQQNFSCQFQKSVYKNLAKYVHLRHLNLGGLDSVQSGTATTGADHTAPDCLELTLESGLSELASIPFLETLGVGGLNHRMGTKDLKWMCQHWPLKKLSGLEYLRADPENQLEAENMLDRVKISMMISEMTNKNNRLPSRTGHAAEPQKPVPQKGHPVREIALDVTQVEWPFYPQAGSVRGANAGGGFGCAIGSNLTSLKVHGHFDYYRHFRHDRKSTVFVDHQMEVSEDFFAEMDGPGGVALWSGSEDDDDDEYSSPGTGSALSRSGS